MLRALLQKSCQNIPPTVVGLAERCRPTDDVALVNISAAVNIGSGIEE